MSGQLLEDVEQLAKRAVACKGWRWMRGMLCLVDEDGYGARIVYVGHTGGASQTADSYEGGGIITTGCIREGSLPDLTDPATMGCIMSLVREAWGEPGLSCIGWRTDEGASSFMMMGGDNYKMKSVIMGQTEHSTRAEAVIVALEWAGGEA